MTGVEGNMEEQLALVLPLALRHRPGVEWLSALEQAVRFSLASSFTRTLSELPGQLMGYKITDGEPIIPTCIPGCAYIYMYVQ